ncbi:MAG: hypothetical protein RIQ83_2385 [Pseudomonadota bacterium]|jgi:hypothetical protein
MNQDIFEFLAISEQQSPNLFAISHSPSSFYRTFRIKKRSGGYRELKSPYPLLLELQRIILEKSSQFLKIHNACFSYRKEKSFIDNAKYHLNGECILTMDIEDFFGSITRQMVLDTFLFNGLTLEVSQQLSYLTTCNNSLPQGAPTSPILSNAIFYRIDVRLSALSKSLGLKYSRYADDLVFSGKNIPKNFPSYISNILRQHGFSLNNEKTKLKLKSSRKIITGISISSGTLKVPKPFKRSLRSLIHNFERSSFSVSSSRNPMIFEEIIGKLNYFLQVEPHNNYAQEKRKLFLAEYRKFISY